MEYNVPKLILDIGYYYLEFIAILILQVIIITEFILFLKKKDKDNTSQVLTTIKLAVIALFWAFFIYTPRFLLNFGFDFLEHYAILILQAIIIFEFVLFLIKKDINKKSWVLYIIKLVVIALYWTFWILLTTNPNY